MLYCGSCGARMYHKSKQQRDGSYKPQAWCPGKNVDTGMPSGCGKVSRMTAPIIDLVTEAVMCRLDSPQLAQALEQQKSANNPTRELGQQLRILEARMSELNHDYYVTKLLSRDEFETLRESTKAEITDTEKQIHEFTSTALLGGMDIGRDVRTKWDSESIEWRRDVLGHLIERVCVHPRGSTEGYKVPTYKQWKFDVKLIEIKWKV
ncbi:recombinase zinc beta ribbon domain-containing protein [Gordonia sp. CNJ-863]|uniref:recombinase zinc beta ribbon domain-containing protein n=1 Tax=Gordonia sp. CNJ-863 TaxID=1904963 RepID=UPI00096AC17F|nr:recombinase zinc beta ribbon domain-containing protein [Gordonia sp. CNJ-863]